MLRHGALQVEYAMEAVKQGSAAIGLRSRNHVVLACVNKAQSEVSSHQKKIFKVDDHIGVAIAGLTVDGRVLSRYMRSESINHSFTYESPLPVGRRSFISPIKPRSSGALEQNCTEDNDSNKKVNFSEEEKDPEKEKKVVSSKKSKMLCRGNSTTFMFPNLIEYHHWTYKN
ncbi:unnamed protein product [Arabis nemorensis]|uniref:Proteasome alpha-type subunits domain-containing protein n=1 Tax=Arabis nemorensis TaxID=586526 RepID=A0A565BMQ0_9BRAS|nr:unnamed protein product [Arabis nemorensis]